VALIQRERTHDLPGASSLHEEKAVAFFGAWAIIGLYLDGWAHIHNKPETFFSPWHGVLYSSVGAAVVYFGFREYILRKPSALTDRWLGVGFFIFIAGAGLDLVWHEVFGIEVDLEALLSPTHLMLLTGGVLMLSYPARAAAERGGGRQVRFRQFWPVLVSLTLVALVVQFFTQYFAAHRFGGLWVTSPGRGGNDMWEVAIIGAVFVTNLILLSATFVAVRRWDTPMGTFTLMYTTVAVGVTGMFAFETWRHIPAALVAGLVTDLLARRLRPSAERRRQALAFACLVPFVIWSMWLIALYLTAGIRWSVDLWGGTVYLTVLEGLGLGVLAFPRPASVPVEVVAGAHVTDEPLHREDQL
jgi:hypothetical protein